MNDQSPEFVLDRFMPYRLAVLAADVSRALGEVYGRDFGLTIPEWRIVANLGHFGPLYAGELAERSHMDKPKVTRALQRLESSHLVSRAIDQTDRRQARLSLTRKGTATFKNIAALATVWERELMSPLDAKERETLERCLAKLAARTSEMHDKMRLSRAGLRPEAKDAKEAKVAKVERENS